MQQIEHQRAARAGNHQIKGEKLSVVRDGAIADIYDGGKWIGVICLAPGDRLVLTELAPPPK